MKKETVSEEFQNIRRSVLVLTPKKPFYDWVKSVEEKLGDADPDGSEVEPFGEPDVYLLPDYETKEEIERWLKQNFDWLFSEQLNNWYVDEDLWVQNRTFAMLREWFDYSLHTMVRDSLDGPIDKLK